MRVWVPPEFFIAPDSALFNQIIERFEAAYPGVRVELSAKRAFGKGGLLDMLLGASQVAAGYIPDLILMSDDETASAADKGLLETLEPILSTPAAENVFPNLLAAGTNSGMRYGLPFALDFLHLAYRTSSTISFPLNWTSVMASGGLYLFASGSSENYSSDSILIQYLGVDGVLTDAEGGTTLDSRLLTRVLDSYKQLSDSGTLAAESLRLNSTEGVWDAYRLGEANFAEVWASQFREEVLSVSDTAYARIPTRNGRAATLAHVWMWSIPARAPERQQAAISFLEWAMLPSRQRAWCEPSRLLPAGPQAWPLSGISSDHNRFLMLLAEEASPFPAALRAAAISAALQESLSQVVSGSALPRQAAEQAIAKMKLQ